MDSSHHGVMDDVDIESAGMRIKVRASLALFKNLAQVLQTQQFCDLVFELSGSIKFHTHRLVIALWSPVMMKLLQQSSSKVERVLVKSHLQGAFKQFIHFLYTGTFDGNITDIDGVLLLASTFQIPLLRSLCERQLQQTVSIENVIGLFHISVRYQLSFLEKQCVDYIREHLPEVAQQSELKDLNPEQFNTFLASQHVSKINPEMKLFLIISWLTEHVNERQHFLVLLLRHIDWSTVAQDFLTEISQTENFFTSHPSSLYLLLQTLHSASISLGPYTDRFEELRSEYSEILNTVVVNSVNIGNGRLEIFQPIQLTLISGPAKEEKKPLTKSKKSESTLSSPNKSNSKTIKVKLDLRSKKERATNKSSSSNISTGSRNKANKVLGNKNLRQRENAGKQTRSGALSTKQSGNSTQVKTASTTLANRSSPRMAGEKGSMRRKTLRPRKVVTNSSGVSIVTPVLSRTRRSTVLQKVERENLSLQEGTENVPSTSAGLGANAHESVETEGEEDEEDHNDPLKTEDEDVLDYDDNDEDYVDPSTLKQTRKERAKKEKSKTMIVPRKSKMGRPRKGYERSKFSCPQCEYVTRHSYLIDKHIRQVHESKRIIKCPICEYQCNWNKKLYIHMRTDHYNNSGPPFVCDIQECTYSSDKMNKLVEHRRSHTGDKPFMCDECKMSFRSKSNLYAHFKCHNDVRDYECPICQQRFKMKITLKQHLVVHDEARPFVCNLCGFSTKYQAHLKAHRRKHSGDVFPCTFPSCTYSTPKKSTLQAHMRSHLGIRHHVCETCQKAFIEKSHLVRHMRIHSSEKQHKCQQCDYASHRLDKLREHQHKHEREAKRNAEKDAVSIEMDIDGVPNKDTPVPSEPKKRKRRKKGETNQKDVQSKVKNSAASDTSSKSQKVSESNSTFSTSASDKTLSSVQGTGRPSDSTSISDNLSTGTTLPPADLTMQVIRKTDVSSVVEPRTVIIETGPHFEHGLNTQSYTNGYDNDNPHSLTVVPLPAPKQERDWNEIEILARMGFTEPHSVNPQTPASVSAANVVHVTAMTEASNPGEDLKTGIVNSSSASVGGNDSTGNRLPEFTDMFRRYETLPTPSSTSVEHASELNGRNNDHNIHQYHHQQHPHQHHNLLPHHHSLHSGIPVTLSAEEIRIVDESGDVYTGPPPTQSIVLASYPASHEVLDAPSSQYVSVRTVKNSSTDPHPLIMIPNISSAAISSPPQTYHHHSLHQQQQQHQHQHHHPPDQSQQHHHQHHHQQIVDDDDQPRYHHHRQHPSSSSSTSSSLSLLHQHHHQQILHQQQQSNPSGQSSSNYPHYTEYPY